ncbi:MAG: hypothetical protein ABID38_02760 [Candidatus Diapherotrites archaeon]
MTDTIFAIELVSVISFVIAIGMIYVGSLYFKRHERNFRWVAYGLYFLALRFFIDILLVVLVPTHEFYNIIPRVMGLIGVLIIVLAITGKFDEK